MQIRETNQKAVIWTGILACAMLFWGSSHYMSPIWALARVDGYIILLFSALPLLVVSLALRKDWFTNLYFVAFIAFVLISGFSGALARQTQGVV